MYEHCHNARHVSAVVVGCIVNKVTGNIATIGDGIHCAYGNLTAIADLHCFGNIFIYIVATFIFQKHVVKYGVQLVFNTIIINVFWLHSSFSASISCVAIPNSTVNDCDDNRVIFQCSVIKIFITDNVVYHSQRTIYIKIVFAKIPIFGIGG